jgi:hypothetical protein
MRKITLVCSTHRPNGLCNARELLEILRAIKPDVVFEEMLPADFDSYYRHRTESHVESQAITRYREFKSFQQVPVDRYDMPVNLLVEIKTEYDSVRDCVEQKSQEYRELNEEINRGVNQFGFKYINSVACATMLDRTFEIEEKTIIETGDQRLIRGLKRWRDANQKRELEMIGNIYQYCRENVFDTGVFLVGAGHKTGIVKEIEKHASAEADLISWKVVYGGNIS